MRLDIAIPTTLAAILMTVTLTGATLAADRDDDQDAKALQGAKITLVEAITTAEQQAGGRAVSADIEQERGLTLIEVEVVGPQGVRTVMVDAQTGQVTATRDGDRED